MILYDVKRSLDDENHDRYHCVITNLLLEWKKVNSASDQYICCLELSMFNELITESDLLPGFQRVRLAQNIKNSIRGDHYSSAEFNERIQKFENCKLVKSGLLNDVIKTERC